MFPINITLNCRVLFIFAVSDGFSFFSTHSTDLKCYFFYPTEEMSFVRCSQSKLSLSRTCHCRNVQALSLWLLVRLNFFLFSLWTVSVNAIYSLLFTNVYPLYWFLLKTFVVFGWKHPVLLISMWIIYLCPNVKSVLTKSPPCSPPCLLAFPVSAIIRSVSLCLLDVGFFATVQWELFNLG